MAMNANTLAADMLTAYDSAGKLTGMDTASKDTLKADWAFMFGLLFKHLIDNMEVATTLDSSLNTIFTGGVPVPLDGGAVLQTAWITATTAGVKDGASGTVS